MVERAQNLWVHHHFGGNAFEVLHSFTTIATLSAEIGGKMVLRTNQIVSGQIYFTYKAYSLTKLNQD